MLLSEQRAIALGAVRSQLRASRIDPLGCSARDAHAVLDDLARQFPDLLASLWYVSASSHQMHLFYAEWDQWRREREEEFLGWASKVSWAAPGSEGPDW